jgi:hypothetical protein
MEGTKRIISIAGKDITIIDKELNQRDLEFYSENPRVFTALQSLEDPNPSQEQIQKIMIDRVPSVKTLKANIKAHGGLMVPIIVKGNVVIEGNSRLAAYRLLAKDDPEKWKMIRCSVLPDDFSQEMIDYLLCNTHIIGQRPWNPFEKAGQLYRTKERSRKRIEVIAGELGMKVSDVKKLLRVYQAMLDAKDIRPSRWSFYDELLNNAPINKADKENPELNIIGKITDKIKNDELEDAHQDIRDIAKVVKSQHEDSIVILGDYLDGSLSLSEAVELAGDINKGQSIKKATLTFDRLINENFKFVKQLLKSDADLMMELKQIQNNLEGLLSI